MKQMPQIQKLMTTLPHTIGKDIPLNIAANLMREHRIRHLPVQEVGKLVGVLTDRDVKLATAFADPKSMKVEDVMTPDPYVARPEAPLNKVVLEMAEHKYGCAIVQQDNGKVVGIFTAIDALRAFSDTLSMFYKSNTQA